MARTPEPDTPAPTTVGERPAAAVGRRPQELADGRYTVDRLLGTGGMGLVYAATDSLLGRPVAVKLLADNLAADAEARRRFRREAQSAARITHANVVQVFDVGEHDGRPYFVMELVDGPSLADLLHAHGTLPAGEVTEIAEQVLAGLGRAHEAGLLHRDLKPANVLRAPDGTIKVTDFGVAQVTELPQMTRTGLVLGTLPYLAPERMTGAAASARTDLYSLGATLLELLTGHPPDEAEPGQRAVPTPAQLDTVPPRLAGLVTACLATDPDARPASVAAAQQLLREGALAPTVPVERPRRQTTAVLTAGHEPPATAEGADVDPEAADGRDRAVATAGAAPRRGRRGGPWLVLAGLTALIVATLVSLGDPESERTAGSSPAPERTTPAVERSAAPAPGGADPAERIRELSDWIREQAGR